MLINCEAGLKQHFQQCEQHLKNKGAFFGEIKEINHGKDKLRGTIEVIYKIIAESTGNEIRFIRAFCKYEIGVPIRREEEKYNKEFEQCFGHMDYESIIDYMGPCALYGINGFSVTRRMNETQKKRYIHEMKASFKNVNFKGLL